MGTPCDEGHLFPGLRQQHPSNCPPHRSP
jgi:hypothetical protein